MGQLTKKAPFSGVPCAAQCAERLAGLVRGILGREKTDRDTDDGSSVASLAVWSWRSFEML